MKCFVSFSLRVQYILNITREIDNFFPGVFEYHNIRVYDEEATDLLAYWNDTYKFISRAKWVSEDHMFSTSSDHLPHRTVDNESAYLLQESRIQVPGAL